MNLSKAARQELGHSPEGEEFSIQWKACLIDEAVIRRLGFDFIMSKHWKWYGWICQQYLTKDFSVTDALKLAHILEAYPYGAIEKAIKVARVRGVYTIPYLAGILETEGAQLVEDVRREQRINHRILETVFPTLPEGRYPALTKDLYEHDKLQNKKGEDHD